LGLSGSVGGNNEAANFNFANIGNGLNLTGSARTITLGSSGSMTFGQTIRNGSLTLNRLDSASAGQLVLSGSNTITALTLDSVKLAASTSNFALGSGTVTLTGSSNYTGGTTLTAGTLALGNTSALGRGNLAVSGGTLDLKGNSIAVATLSGSSGGIITSSTTGAVTLTGSSASDATFAGSIQSGSGTVAFVKQGAGTLTLSGSSNYSGATTISAGTLLVNGSLTNSAVTAVTVGSGATVGGSGALGALLTVLSGGVLSPGNSPGALAAAALDLQAGSTTFMEVIGSGAAAGVAGTDYDQIQITTSGGLTYGGSLNLAFGNSTKFLNGTVFDLFAFSGVAIGDFSSVFTTGTGLYAGKNLSGTGGIWTTTIGDQLLSLSKLTGRLTISGSAVPEIDPAMGASALSLVAGVVAMLEQRRRRTA
jgi:autotransporter-associated beta strand protein